MKSENKVYPAMTRYDLENTYNVCYRTLRKWLRAIPNLDSKYKQTFTPKEVKLIFEHLGEPDLKEDDD